MNEAERTPSRIGPRQIPLDDLVPHPLNSNVMSTEYREKLLAHVRRTGRYPFLVVRRHPTEVGKFQVLDGHHRIGILRELGHTEARCDCWDVDDREAKLLLATLNRLEGQDQPLRRAQLLHELLGEWSAVDLGGLLPETEAEILDLHSLLEFPADEIAEQLIAEANEREKTLPVVIHFVVSHEQAELIETAVEKASDGVVGRDRKARGLYQLARHFLGATNGAG
ncbi:MAG: ParB/RepB/Spo0J family partition protein [Candidatus Eisenbacteria bacterium]